MTLFDHTYPAAPGYKDDQTSKEAAEAIAGRVHLLRNRCLTALTQSPMTADEVSVAIGESVLSTRPRITELLQLGKIEDTGDRRANASGRRAKIWKVIND